MTFRVTASLGRSHLDRSQLHGEGVKLDHALRHDADVAVDPVKAAIDLTLTVDAPDALMAATLTLARIVTAFESTGLERPPTVVNLVAEAVPRAVEADPFTSVI